MQSSADTVAVRHEHHHNAPRSYLAVGKPAIQNLFAHRLSQKRGFTLTDETAAKRQRVRTALAGCGQVARSPSVRLQCALGSMREVLQSCPVHCRRALVQRMDPRLQAALAAFMLEESHCLGMLNKQRGCSSSRLPISCSRSLARLPLSGFAGVRATTSTKYKAYMDIKALRMYTGGQPTIADAIHKQAVLSQVRIALQEASSSDGKFWNNADKVCNIFRAVFAANGMSEQSMDLKVFVSLRADHWLGRKHHITSPLMPLEKAACLHARMLKARDTSWDAFRAIWIQLMVERSQAFSIGIISAREAAKFADAARQEFAMTQLAKLTRDAMRALKSQSDSHLAKMRRAAVLPRKRVKMGAAKEASRRRLHAERWRWLQRRDLTTQDLLHGFPVHLRDV